MPLASSPVAVSPPLPVSAAPVSAPTASGALRTAVGLGGVVAFGLATLLTLGSAILAPVGVLVASWYARRRGRALTWFSSWVGAAVATVVGVVLVATVIAASLPAGSLATVQQQVADSSAARAEARRAAQPGGWLQRMAPPPPSASASLPSRIVQGWAQVIGGLIGVSVIAAIAGTLGWGASLLLRFGLRGTWPRSHAAVAELSVEPASAYSA